MMLLFSTLTNPEFKSLLADPIDRGTLNLDSASSAAQGVRDKSNLVNMIDSHLSSLHTPHKLSIEASVGTTRCTCTCD